MRTILIMTLLLFAFNLVIFSQNSISKITPQLQTVLSKASGEVFIDAYAKFKDKYPTERLMKQNVFLNKTEKRKNLVKKLKDFTAEKQKNVMAFLKDAQKQGKVKKLEALWTLNYIIFSGTPEIITRLANDFDEIKEIRYDPKYPLKTSMDMTGNIPNDISRRPDEINSVNPGITLLGVEDVWAQGYTGQGVLVASIDEGCAWSHPDLVNNIWQNLGEDADDDGKVIEESGDYLRWVIDEDDLDGIDNDENGYVDDLIGWDYEFGTNNVFVYTDMDGDGDIENELDGSDHGTATASIIAGYLGEEGISTGVAPGAKIINFRIGPSHTGNFLASQYIIDMCNVDIITQSQSFKWYEGSEGLQIPDYAAFREMAETELAAGIIHFNSISNVGNAYGPPLNIGTPGNCPPPWLHPDQTLTGGLSSIMGVGNIDVTTDEIYSSSPVGPTAWEDYTKYSGAGVWWLNEGEYPYSMPEDYRDYPYALTPFGMGLIKPDVSAPGQHTESLGIYYNGSTVGYTSHSFSGTSGATPHAAGVAALLLSANPYLTPSDISRIMQTTAVEKGTSGKDNYYGAGRVNAYDAVQEAVSELPVELVSFTASIVDNGIELKWYTETEVNNYGFEVLRSTQTDDWEKIGFVEGSGNSNSPKHYSFLDKFIHPGKYSYRLKQIDNDGSYKILNTVQIAFGSVEKFQLNQNYPNPFNPNTTISFTLPKSGITTLKVFNAIGEEVTTIIDGFVEVGSHSFNFNAEGLASGIYLYRLVTEDGVQTKKMLYIK
ncbi:S8 family peptidase [bacterium BMS3Abin03]|nr:S8 family peptidase [bacterium BMS3Abin03]